MNKDEVRARISAIGVVPVIRASSLEEAQFAVEAVRAGGIPIVEITMSVPGAIEIIRNLAKSVPDAVVGAGTVLDVEAARRCLDAGAEFLVTPGLDVKTVEFALRENRFMMAGALTPTEVITAWQAGSDFVKVFPCAQVGGPAYIKALLGPFPGIPLVPTGGVNLHNAGEYIAVGSAALGVGAELVLKPALKSRAHDVIRDTARKFFDAVDEARRWAPPIESMARRGQA